MVAKVNLLLLNRVEVVLNPTTFYDVYHKDDVVNKNEGKINDYHTRHEDHHLEIYCDNHPDAAECKVYDD